MNPPALRALIADSLTLWGVAGRVDIADAGVRITAGDLVLHVAPALPEEAPMRWWLISEARRRPAASMLGAAPQPALCAECNQRGTGTRAGCGAIMIPVSVITGFLGSGKTTLLRSVLRDPAYAGSAVIVNEWGDIGLDHELLETSEENLLGLANGCLCCTTRGDLARTLIDLAARRRSGAVTYHRVLIETSGLADPAPILHTLLVDPTIAESHRIEAVVTVVDALLGGETIARHPEARQQAMLADRLLLSKTDLAPDTSALEAQLAELNLGAPILRAVQGAIPPDMLFASAARPEALRHWLDATATPSARHSAGVETISILREDPLPGVVLPLFLEALAEHASEKLLRMKGIIRVAEVPEKPAVLHGVRHVLHPIEWLEDWPSADRRSRLVLIGQGIPQWWPARLLEALEEEARA